MKTKQKKWIIDTHAPPKIPYMGWTVESHKGNGKIEWDPKRFSLYLSDKQKNGNWIKGTDLQKELETQTPMNANVLDFLLAHQDLIPEEWKKQYVYFHGTVFRRSDGDLCVRYWYWDDGALRSSCGWLADGWGGQGPALVVASALKISTELSDPESFELRLVKLEKAVFGKKK